MILELMRDVLVDLWAWPGGIPIDTPQDGDVFEPTTLAHIARSVADEQVQRLVERAATPLWSQYDAALLYGRLVHLAEIEAERSEKQARVMFESRPMQQRAVAKSNQRRAAEKAAKYIEAFLKVQRQYPGESPSGLISKMRVESQETRRLEPLTDAQKKTARQALRKAGLYPSKA